MANEHVFVYDESGLQGYLKTQPQKNDFALLAGVLMPAAIRTELQQALDVEFQALDLTGVNKLHATELFQNHNNLPIKAKVLQRVRDDDRLAIVYEAISCYGYFNRRECVRGIRDSAMAARTNTEVRLNSHEEAENVYHEALEGLLIKLDCYLNGGSVTMISDSIDPTMLKESEEKVNYLSQEECTHVVKAYNLVQKRPASGAIMTRIDKEYTLQCTYTFQTEATSLTLLADIVTNSVYRHLLLQLEAGNLAGLNSRTIMAGHILENRIVLLSDDNMTDLLFPRT